jgi:hypothetical protein
MRTIVPALALLLGACADGTAPSVGERIVPNGVTELSPAADSTITVAGGAAGAEYVLVPFYATAAAAPPLRLTIAGTGTEAVPPTAAPVASTPRLAVAGIAAAPTRDDAFHASLRRRERRALAPGLAAARRALVPTPGSARAARAVVPVVGSTLAINAGSASACARPDYRTGRVAAVSARAVIVTDSANPGGGFSDAEYAAIGAAFDSLVYPTITANFGTTSDIDDNGGRSVIFFTAAVNALTPAGSDAYVGGFFFGRDLLPTAECAASNRGEMFYLLAPDPFGAVNGHVRSKDFVRGVTTGVLAHEFQHLISQSRRMYVTNAGVFETLWLDEGLSHVAEELIFFEASGLAPRRNLGVAALRAAAGATAAFNDHEFANFARLRSYLVNPEGNGPFADNDSLATRGATWQFLRYAADQHAGDHAAIWTRLVDSRTAGLASLSSVLGEDALAIARRWTAAQFADDIATTAPAAYQQLSWNYRELFGALGRGTAAFPLLTHDLAAGSPVTVSLVAGGAAYLRFRVPANVTAEVAIAAVDQALPASLGVTLLRVP